MLYVASGPYLILGMSSGQVCVYSINAQKIILRSDEGRYLEKGDTFDPQGAHNEIIRLQMFDDELVAVNDDQTVFIYKFSRDALDLMDVRSLYHDELIDAKFLNETFAVFCSNSDSLKLLNLANG